MNIADVRLGIADKLAEIDNVRALTVWPNSPQWGSQTMLVLLPDDPYVQYPEGTGRPSKVDLYLRLVALPLNSMLPERVQAELDELISVGSSELRSVRDKLAEDISAGGAACAVWVTDVSVRSFRVGENDAVGAEFKLHVIARGT